MNIFLMFSKLKMLMFTWPTIFFKFNFRNGTKVLISLILFHLPTTSGNTRTPSPRTAT